MPKPDYPNIEIAKPREEKTTFCTRTKLRNAPRQIYLTLRRYLGLVIVDKPPKKI